MDEKKKVGGVYLNSITNKGIYCAVMFIANAVLTRYLGVELKGEYTYVANMSSIISILLGLGIYQSIPYYNRQIGNDKILEEYTNIFIFQSIVYVACTLVIGVIFQNSALQMILILSIADITSQQFNMLMLVKDLYIRNRIFIIGAAIMLGLYVVLFLFLEGSVWYAVAATVAAKVISILCYLKAINKKVRPFSVKFNLISNRVKFGYLPMLSMLLITFNYRIDVIMLKAAKNVTKEMLSFYSLGVTIAEIAWVIPDVFKDVVFSKSAKGNNYKEVSAVIRLSNFIMVIVIAGVCLFGKIFIQICYGKEFVPAYGITIWLFLGIPIMSWFKIIYPLFNAQGRRKISFNLLLLSALANVGGNYLFIPRFGIEGAAFASILSYFICGITFLVAYSWVSGEKIYNLIVLKKGDIKMLWNSQM